MIGATVRTVDTSQAVVRAVEKANFRNFSHAAAAIRKTVRASIETSDEPSLPGEPPHTRGARGKNLPDAVVYDATKEDALIGSRGSRVGKVARALEFGGEFRGQEFDARPFMLPALQQNLDRFAREWAGSIQ